MLYYSPLHVASGLVLFHYTCMAETVFVQHKNCKADVPVDCKIICVHIYLAFPSYLISICVGWRGFLCGPFDSTPTSNSDCPCVETRRRAVLVRYVIILLSSPPELPS